MIFRIQSILVSLAAVKILSFIILFSSYNGPSVVQSFAFQSFPGSYQASHLQYTTQSKIKYQGDNVLQTRKLLSSFGSYIAKEAQKSKGSPNYFQSISRQSSLYSMNSDSDNVEENEKENVEASTPEPEQEQEVDQATNDADAEATDENPMEEEPLKPEKVKSEAAKDTVLNSIAFLSKKYASLEAEIKSKNETINQLEAQYVDLEAEWGASVSSMRDDFENLKERYLNDTLQYSADGKIKVFTEMITTLEDLERAERMNKAKGDNEKAIEKEYKAISDKMIEVMKAMGVEEVETVGKEFNYEYHDALFTEPSEEYPEEYITKELAKGFLLNGKCIRAAKVATSEGPGP